MQANYFIGIDGGASKCRLRLEDEKGTVLGQAVSGPANIRLSVEQAWSSIHTALQEALNPLSLSLNSPSAAFHLCAGIAGCEVRDAYEAFIKFAPQELASLTVISDAQAACLGAHEGRDGAIVIIGTGVAGYQCEKGQITTAGGFGFPHDDTGGGAWLGLRAVHETCKAYDGRAQISGLAEAVKAHFQQDKDAFTAWANQADSTAFAVLAPLVVQQAEAGDDLALSLLKQAAVEIEEVLQALYRVQQQSDPLPCALTGGLARFLIPHFSEETLSRLVPAVLPPEAGAILLIRQRMGINHGS